MRQPLPPLTEAATRTVTVPARPASPRAPADAARGRRAGRRLYVIVRWKWLVTAGALTYPLYLLHYVAGTTLISRLRDTMDPRLLVVAVIAGFCLLGWLVHRCVERPVSRLLRTGLDASFAQLRNARAE